MTALEDRDPGDENRPAPPRLTPESAADLRLGDTVHHHPTGEDWVLRYVNGDRLSWLGWPPGEASVADCSLVSRCSNEEHSALLARVERCAATVAPQRPELFGAWTLREAAPARWCVFEGNREAWADAEKANLSFFDGNRFIAGPPIAAIERLLALRRAALAPEDPLAVGVRSLVEGLDAIRAKALAPEAQAPSGEPWRPAVGERCFLFASGEWRLAERIEDEFNGVRRYRSLTATRATVTWFEVPEYDGVRPLGSLPVPPSCGGEPEPRERVDRPTVASERPGLARLIEWARANGSDGCLEAIESEIAALAPPSLAEDLRTPEPGAFEGAVIVGGDDQLEREIEALAREVAREDRNRAVREALAELRGELGGLEKELDAVGRNGLVLAVAALDRLAARLKP